MDKLIKSLAAVFYGTPFEYKIWLVGGAVRDELLRLPCADPDIMVEGDACEAVRLLCSKGGAFPVYLPEYNSAKVTFCGAVIELTGGRSDTYFSGSRKPVTEYADISEDAFRRDLTINTLYKSIFTGELLDPTGMGMEDISSRVLRTPIDPQVSFCQDPLRILRTVRFACLPKFSLAPEVKEAIRNTAFGLNILSGERILEELIKLFEAVNPRPGLELMMELGIFGIIIPELCLLQGLEQGKHHIYDAWEHTVCTVCNVKDPYVRFAALLHDISKPAAAVNKNGETAFPKHAEASAEMAGRIFSRLRMPKNEAKRLCSIIEAHSIFFNCPADKDFREAVHRYRDVLPELLQLAEGDKLAANPLTGPRRLAEMKQRYDRLFEPWLLENELSPLSGDEISAVLKVKGAEIGRIKRMLRNCVLEGTIAFGDKQAAKKIIKEIK